MSAPLPPRPATWLLASLLPDGERAALIGDLAEEYVLRLQSERPNATRWYWQQALRSLPRLVWGACRRGSWGGALGAAFSAYVFVVVVESGAQIALLRRFGPGSVLQSGIALLVGLAAMVAGGFLAAWLRRGAATGLAVIYAVIAIALMIAFGDASPRWLQLLFLILGPAAALYGGALLRRQQTRHAK